MDSNRFPLQEELEMNMNKVYFLSSCDTCRKIIKSLPQKNNLVFQDIKQNLISPEDLEFLHQLSGSYEKLFSKKAQLYQSLGLKNKVLSETDFREFILQHYTFLKRPVFVIGDKIFIGNNANELEELHKLLAS